MILFWLALILMQEILLSSSTILQDAFHDGGFPMDKPLEELVRVVHLVKENKPKELKEFFAKASCEMKIQYTDYTEKKDASDPFALEYPSLESMLLTSMYGCALAQVYAARMRSVLDRFCPRLKDITEVMVAVSETSELHDAFLKAYGNITRDNHVPDLKDNLENSEPVLDTDTKNVCLEMANRKRRGPDSQPINVQEAAQKLKDEIGDWEDKRENLDAIMMETPFDELVLIFEEFKKINGGKSLVDTFFEQFGNDADKLTVYKELVAIATDRITYYADEIQARLINVEPGEESRIGFNIIIIRAMSKEDRDKLKIEYKKKYNIELLDHLDETLSTSGFKGVLRQLMKLYLDDLEKL